MSVGHRCHLLHYVVSNMRQHAIALSFLITHLFLHSALAKSAADCTPGLFFNGKKCKKCPPGTYQPFPGKASCIKCPKGTFNIFKGAQGIDLCEPCRPNTFSDTIGAKTPSSCKRCPKGSVSVSGAAACITCPRGTFVALPKGGAEDYFRGYNFCNEFRGRSGKQRRSRSCYAGDYPRITECRPCPIRTISTKKNSRECESCPDILFTTKEGSTKCEGCPAGKICVRGRIVGPCRGFRFNPGGSICQGCGPGATGNSQLGATSCVPCPPGTFKQFDPRGCARCKKGKSVVLNGTACLELLPKDTGCPDNSFRHADGVCAKCEKWQRLNIATMKCEECPANMISKGGSDTTCRDVPIGSSRELGEERVRCIPGWEAFQEPFAEFSCRKCPAGTFSTQFRRCEPCPPGTFSPTAGSTKCKKCAFNFVQPLMGQSKCERCSRGTVPNAKRGCVSAATNCAPGFDRITDKNNVIIACSPNSCPDGTFRQIKSFPIDSDVSAKFAECVTCTFRERYDPSLNECVRCSGGEFSTGGTDKNCAGRMCENGFALFFSTGECNCRFGREVVNGLCRLCGIGSFGNVGEGCRICPVGRFSNRPGMISCLQCPVDTFNNMTGATMCNPCPSGTFTYGMTENTNCVAPGGLVSS